MAQQTVTFHLTTADKTRKAQVTMPRSKKVGDIIKASRKQWHLRFGMDYQIANLTTGHQLLLHDTLSFENIQDGDTLILQPLPMHGRF